MSIRLEFASQKVPSAFENRTETDPHSSTNQFSIASIAIYQGQNLLHTVNSSNETPFLLFPGQSAIISVAFRPSNIMTLRDCCLSHIEMLNIHHNNKSQPFSVVHTYTHKLPIVAYSGMAKLAVLSRQGQTDLNPMPGLLSTDSTRAIKVESPNLRLVQSQQLNSQYTLRQYIGFLDMINKGDRCGFCYISASRFNSSWMNSSNKDRFFYVENIWLTSPQKSLHRQTLANVRQSDPISCSKGFVLVPFASTRCVFSLFSLEKSKGDVSNQDQPLSVSFDVVFGDEHLRMRLFDSDEPTVKDLCFLFQEFQGQRALDNSNDNLSAFQQWPPSEHSRDDLANFEVRSLYDLFPLLVQTCSVKFVQS